MTAANFRIWRIIPGWWCAAGRNFFAVALMLYLIGLICLSAADRAVGETHFQEGIEGVRVPRQEIALAELAYELEQGFQTAQPERILQFFHFFPEKAAPEDQFKLRRQARHFFRLFFEIFGPTQAFHEGTPSQEKLQLSRVYAVHSDVLDQVECDFAYHNFLATLKSGKGAVWINAGVCRTPQNSRQPVWIKDLAVALVAPDKTFRDKAATFQERYKQQIRAVQEEYRQLQREERQRRVEAAAGAVKTGAEAGASVPAPSQGQRYKIPAPEPEQPAVSPANPDTTISGGEPSAGGMFPDKVNILFLLRFFSGTVITMLLAAGLIFYLFYCLCLYVIARKLAVPLAWLAWVPVAQVHPQVLAAGLSAWWTAAIIGTTVLSVVPFVGLLLGLAMLVVFVYLWMRISERLNVNRWLGLLIILPLAQFIYPAWLAFKKDEERASVPIKRILIRTLLVFLILTVFCWGLATYLITPALAPLMTMFDSLQQPGQMCQVPQVADDVEKELSGAAIREMGREDYEKFLATARPPAGEGWDKGPDLRLGPSLVRYGTFWADEKSPHFWLKVILPPLANLKLGTPAALHVENVLDKAGNNLYDPDNSFEKGRFVNLDFQEMGFDTPRLEAIRDVHLLAGAAEMKLASVTGELVLKFPLDITRLSLAPSGAAKQEAHGFTACLEKIEGNQASMVFTGNLDNHLGTFAYNAEGKRMDSRFSSWNTSGDTTRINYGFPGAPVRVELLVCSDRLVKTYPFTLDFQ